MGWTHHWERDPELPKDKFAMAAADCRKVTEFLGVPLGDLQGIGEPVFSEDEIMFNGANGMGCEPFEVLRYQLPRWPDRPRANSYCKTEHMPYDICVQAALIVLKHHFGDTIAVTSDGKDEDWGGARKACQECLGYGDDFRLDKPKVVNG